MTSPFWLPIWLLAFSSAWQSVAPSSCPEGWLAYSNYCYGFFHKKKTWSKAEEECQGYGNDGHLASILNPMENKVISRHIAKYPKKVDNVWIGLHNVYRTNVFQWVDGSPLYYTTWAEYEPEYSLFGKLCIILKSITGYKQWRTVDCEIEANYLCRFTHV